MGDRVYPYNQQARMNDRKLIPPPSTYTAAGRRPRNPLCVCFGWILSLLVIVLIILAIAGVAIYFVLHPKTPKYNLLDSRISQLNVTNNSSQLSYDIAFTLQAYNPNKKIGIYYDHMLIFLSYESALVGQSAIAPFYQGHRNTTNLKSELKGRMISLPKPIGSSLQAAIVQRSIPLHILVKVSARLKIGIWKSPHFKVSDNCDVAVSPPSVAAGGHLLSQSCKVKWRLW